MVAESGGGAPVEPAKARHIRLTSHSAAAGTPTIRWAAPSSAERGPVIGTTTTRAHRNVIGTHSGSYSVYRALAVAAGARSPEHRADLTNTSPTDVIGPYPQWSQPEAIVSLDPWGAMVSDEFAAELAAGRGLLVHCRPVGEKWPTVAWYDRQGRLRLRLAFDLGPGGVQYVERSGVEYVERSGVELPARLRIAVVWEVDANGDLVGESLSPEGVWLCAK